MVHGLDVVGVFSREGGAEAVRGGAGLEGGGREGRGEGGGDDGVGGGDREGGGAGGWDSASSIGRVAGE